MHDQRKVKQEIDEVTREKHLVEIREFRALYDSLLKQREEPVDLEAVLEQLSLLLRKNPEAYTFYNYRRNVLLHIWRRVRKEGVGDANNTTDIEEGITDVTLPVMVTATAASHSACVEEMGRGEDEEGKQHQPVKRELDSLCDELKLNSAILLSDYKVYAAFTHRRWIFAQFRRLAEESITSAPRTSGSDKEEQKESNTCYREMVIRTWHLVLEKEKKQCDALLAIDERNFHVWNYRRWALAELAKMERFLAQHSIKIDLMLPFKSSVEQLMGPSPTAPTTQQTQKESSADKESVIYSSLFTPEEMKELRFTSVMIHRNFSNYSAWHQRGVILKRALQRLQGLPEDVDKDNKATRIVGLTEAWQQLGEDLELIITAIYCDPVDQSAWYYAQFLSWAADALRRISLMHPPTCVDVTTRLIETCINLISEENHMGGEIEAYWPRFYLFTKLLSVTTTGHESSIGTTAGKITRLARHICSALCINESLDAAMSEEEICACCAQKLSEQLVLADPLREGMYRSLLASATPRVG